MTGKNSLLARIALLRGIGNCGRHHEEEVKVPAVVFAQNCSACAELIVITIWNAGVDYCSTVAEAAFQGQKIVGESRVKKPGKNPS